MTGTACGLQFYASGWSPDQRRAQGSSAILSMPRNPATKSRKRNVQSCGLWIDCISNAILTQFGQIAPGVATKCQQSSQDCPTIAIRLQSAQTEPGQNQPKIHSNAKRNCHNQIELRWDCKTTMDRKDCTKILGNPQPKTRSGLSPGVPHRNHDATLQSVMDQSAIHQK